MAKPFLGIGTGFPLRLDPKTGVFLRAEYEESVRESILVILGTAKGERVMRPDFGCGIHDLVFQNLSAGTMGRVQQAVREALLRLEPRIDLTEVVVRKGEADNVLEVHIQYEVRATNNAFNLVYPFYLQQGVPA
jgi:phage baseplate assembly protein W